MQGSLLVLLGAQRHLLVFNRCSLRIVPLVDAFLMYMWGEVNLRFSYSAILTTLPNIFVLVALSFFWSLKCPIFSHHFPDKNTYFTNPTYTLSLTITVLLELITILNDP